MRRVSFKQIALWLVVAVLTNAAALWFLPPAHAQGDLPGSPIRCVVTVSTATTLQAVGGNCLAPGPQQSIYITDILFATNAAGIAADSFNTLKSGTGGTCGTGTAVIWGAFTTAATQATVVENLKTPIRVAANNEICWINSTAGSKFLVINGYVGP